MKVLFADNSFWTASQSSFKRAYKQTVNTAYAEARKYLPWISQVVTFVVQPNIYGSIPETGEGGTTLNAELIILKFDPALPYGRRDLLRHVRATMFHELNHAARFQLSIWHRGLLEHSVFEGLATVFERDRAGSRPLWGDYDAELCAQWVGEIKHLSGEQWNDYMFSHPDGRRWIGYKVGTYLVDEALRKSGKTIEELTQMSPADVMKLAEV